MGMGISWVLFVIMVLGLDFCFDLIQVYWLVVGIVGIDLEDGLIGLVVWVDYLIDGDFVYQIDVREILEDWKIGYFLLFVNVFYFNNGGENVVCNGEMFQFNICLIDWVFNLIKDISLSDIFVM